MINSDRAAAIVQGTLAHARAEQFPPMTVAVLDAGGHLVAFQREDGSSLLRESISRAKAWGALGMGVGTRGLVEKAAHHPAFFQALSAMSGGQVVPVPGGVLIRNGAGSVVGAVGVSGHLPDHDEACAVVGIKAAGLVPDGGAG